MEETAQVHMQTSVCTKHLQVSAAAAYYSTGVFVASRFWILIAGAMMIIAWLNLRYDSAFNAQCSDKTRACSILCDTASHTAGRQKYDVYVQGLTLLQGHMCFLQSQTCLSTGCRVLVADLT